MSDPHLTLYHFPGACSQVSICALEMAGLAYDLSLVDLSQNAQSTPEYLSISPLGKVPLLVIDGEPLTENAAIITYVAAMRPQAGIFPPSPDPQQQAEMIGGLSFCGGTLHPLVRGLANPQRLTTGDDEPVREKSRALATKSFAAAERRLVERGWWLGDLSIVDVYLNWAFGVARNAGFDVTPFPRLDGLRDRLGNMPSFQRMMAIEQHARSTLNL